MAVYGRREPGYAPREYQEYDIQDLQHWKDKIGEAVMILESNIEVLAALRKYYLGLRLRKDFPLQDCEDEITVFAAQVEETMDWMRMQVSRAKLLVDVTSDRKDLVSGRCGPPLDFHSRQNTSADIMAKSIGTASPARSSIATHGAA